jgi:hypothetical protein
MGEIASLLLGFLLGLVPPWFSRKRRLKAHWWALRAELSECGEKAEMLLKDLYLCPPLSLTYERVCCVVSDHSGGLRD